MSRFDSMALVSSRPRHYVALFALLFVLISASQSHGMTDLYQLAQKSGSGTDMSGSTQIYGPYAYYFSSTYEYPIGFTFVFDGTPYTTFSANTSGLMSLGRPTNPSPESYFWPNYSLSSYYPLLTAMWCYYGGPTYDGQVHYKLSGSAPNRILTVEWQNVHLVNDYYYSGGTWQIRLHEGSNLIEYWYGDFQYQYDYYYFSIGMASSDTRYINIWGNDITQHYTYPEGQYFTYRYPEYYPIDPNTIFEFSSCDKALAGIVGNTAQGGTKGMESGKDTLLMGKQVMRGNTTAFRPFSFTLPANPCGEWSYVMSFSGPGAADYSIFPGNGTPITDGMSPTINFTPQGVGLRHATMTVDVSNGERFVYQLKGEGLSRMARIGNVGEGGTIDMNDGDMLLTNIDLPRGSQRDLRPLRINNINTAPTDNSLRNANVTFRLDDPFNQYAMRLETSGNSEKESTVQSVTTLSASVPPGGSVTPVITFAPTPQGQERGTGVQPATLTVTADGEVFVYTINGFSVAPVAEFYFNNMRLIGSDKRLFVNTITCVGEQASSGTFVIDNINKVPVTINSADVFLTENEVRQGTPPYPQQLDPFGQLIPVLDYFITENPTVAPYKANTIVQFPLTIEPGTRRTFHLAFVSQRPGRRFARLFLNTNAVNFTGKEVPAFMPNAGNVPDKEGIMAIDLYGNGIGSHLAKNNEGELKGLSMLFGTVKVAQSATAEAFIHNTGDCDMRISKKDVRLVAGDVFEFELLEILPNTPVDANGDFIIPPGGSDKITARFVPSRSGSRRATVMLRTNDSTLSMNGMNDRGTHSLDLFGTGQAYLETRSLRLAPAVINGPSSKGTIPILNASTQTIIITTAQINGPNAAEFAADPAKPWPTLPLTLNPGEKAQFSIVLTPEAGGIPGERIAFLDMTLSGGAPVSTQITGLAGTREIVANPVSMFRDPVPVGSVKREYAVLTNVGTFPIRLDRISIVGAGADAYSIGMPGRMSLDPGESQFLEVTYAPTTPGTSAAQLEIASDATNGLQRIELGGTATSTGPIGNPSATGTALGGGATQAGRAVAGDGPAISSVIPNPARDKVTISYALGAEGPAEIALYDIAGRQAMSVQQANGEKGRHSVEADVSQLSSGVYYVLIRQGDHIGRQMVIVTR